MSHQTKGFIRKAKIVQVCPVNAFAHFIAVLCKTTGTLRYEDGKATTAMAEDAADLKHRSQIIVLPMHFTVPPTLFG